MRTTTRVATMAASVLAVLAAAAPAEAVRGVTQSSGKPFDYMANQGLSEPRFAAGEIETTVTKLAAFDGAELYMEVTKPKAPGRYPVVLEASPYHGTIADRKGTRILPDPRDEDGGSLGLTGFFPPRGYAVVMFDLRGTGRSSGCLDHLGVRDARDLKQVVEWAASQSWSNGRVGMTGHSYVGSTPMVAAAMRPKGLVTILPSAGLASMYDHQFQAGVPYYLQYVGPIEAYEQLALQRKIPLAQANNSTTGNFGDDAGNKMEETGCGLPNSAIVAGEDQLSGRYADWHAQRDWRGGATDADIPVFIWHGVNDNAARITAAQWFFDRGGRKGDKAWIGQFDHGSGATPTRRGEQAAYAMLTWFDKHLAQRDVDTGPAVEAFLSDGTFAQARTGDRDEVLTAKSIGEADAPSLTLGATPDGKLAPGAAAAGTRTFEGTPQGFTTTGGGLRYTTGPLAQDLVLAGVPEMVLSAATTTPRVHLIATLYARGESTGGTDRRITQCTINPELRQNIAVRSLVVPGTRYDMAPPCMAMAHHVRAGEELILRISTSDADKVPTFTADPRVSVFSGGALGGTSITLPVVEKPALAADDVPTEREEE